LAIINKTDLSMTGLNLIDEAVLRAEGVTDFGVYRYDSTVSDLVRDLYLDR
jgi:hypothetical protein